MEIGLSTACFYPDALTEEALPRIQTLGVGTAEVFLETYSEYSVDFAGELMKVIGDSGIRVHSIHTLNPHFEQTIFSRTERQRRDCLEWYERALDAGAILGAGVYVFHGPARLKGPGGPPNYAHIAPLVRDMAAMAAKRGIRFAWENVFWCWFDHPGFVDELKEYGGTEGLYYTFDLKQAYLSGHDPYGYLSAMRDRLANVHLCDIDGEGNLCLPGRGEIDFAKLGGAIRESGYTGPAILEVYRENYADWRELGEAAAYLGDALSQSSSPKIR